MLSRWNRWLGSGVRDEVVVIQVAPQQALRVRQVQVALEHPTDQDLGQQFGVLLHHQIRERLVERRTDLGGSGEALVEELAAAWLVERFGQKGLEVQYFDVLVTQFHDEGVVFFTSACRPHDVIEKQVLDIRGVKARQLETRSVDDDRLVDPPLSRRGIQTFTIPSRSTAECGLLRSLPNVPGYAIIAPYAARGSP